MTLPGKQFTGPGLTKWHRKLDCGCIVRVWPNRTETYFQCKEHKKQSDEIWKQKPWYQRVLIYSIGIIFIGIPTLAVLLLMLYLVVTYAYILITGNKF